MLRDREKYFAAAKAARDDIAPSPHAQLRN
jgi:hypothetical protein